MGFFDKIDNVSAAATLSKRSFKDRLQNNDCRNKCIFECSLKVNKYCARGNVERYTVPDNTDTHSWISFKQILLILPFSLMCIHTDPGIHEKSHEFAPSIN